MQGRDIDETTATARLPHLDIDIVHRRARAGDAEELSITLHAVPSFQVFGRFLEKANPLQFWATLAETMWLPWFGLLGAAYPPAVLGAVSTRAEDRPKRASAVHPSSG